jgi:hypothetical protein
MNYNFSKNTIDVMLEIRATLDVGRPVRTIRSRSDDCNKRAI